MLRRISLSGALILLLTASGGAAPLDQIVALSFTDASAPAISRALPNAKAATDLVRDLLSRRDDGSVDPALRAEVALNPPAVMDDYAVVSLNRDGRVQILLRVDYTGRGRPTVLIAITKSGNRLRYDLIAGGEGGFGIGSLQAVVQDLNGDGVKEVVLDERKFKGRNGEMYANTELSPMVVNIYSFANDRFELANPRFKSYYQTTVLPQLQSRLDTLQRTRPFALDSEAVQQRSRAIEAVEESIELAREILLR